MWSLAARSGQTSTAEPDTQMFARMHTWVACVNLFSAPGLRLNHTCDYEEFKCIDVRYLLANRTMDVDMERQHISVCGHGMSVHQGCGHWMSAGAGVWTWDVNTQRGFGHGMVTGLGGVDMSCPQHKGRGHGMSTGLGGVDVPRWDNVHGDVAVELQFCGMSTGCWA